SLIRCVISHHRATTTHHAFPPRRSSDLLATGQDSLAEEEESLSRPVMKGGRVVAGMGIALFKLDGSADAPPPLGLADARRYVDADRKSTRLNSSHGSISYAVFCLKKK